MYRLHALSGGQSSWDRYGWPCDAERPKRLELRGPRRLFDISSHALCFARRAPCRRRGITHAGASRSRRRSVTRSLLGGSLCQPSKRNSACGGRRRADWHCLLDSVASCGSHVKSCFQCRPSFENYRVGCTSRLLCRAGEWTEHCQSSPRLSHWKTLEDHDTTLPLLLRLNHGNTTLAPCHFCGGSLRLNHVSSLRLNQVTACVLRDRAPP